jgi:hypothetical protein
MSDVAAELGLPLPLSLTNASVLALAGLGAPPISMSQLLNKTRTAAMTASAPDIFAARNVAGTGNVSGSSTATVNGGTGPYTYAWSYVSGDATLSMTNGTTSRVTLNRSCAPGTFYVAVYQCVINDSAAHSVTIQINVELDGYSF